MDQNSYFCSTIGRKQIMALAGLGLCGFVLMHAAGNMLILGGADTYNRYSYAIIHNPLILVAELGLLAMFVAHILLGVSVTLRNFAARPKGYGTCAKGEKRNSLTTKTMWIQGLILLGFVILHLKDFKYGPEYTTQIDGLEMRDLFKLVYEAFQSPFYVGWYIAAVAILCFHLSHGFYSALQTLGQNHPKYMPKVKCGSVLFGLVVAAMFISQPIYMMFFYKG